VFFLCLPGTVKELWEPRIIRVKWTVALDGCFTHSNPSSLVIKGSKLYFSELRQKLLAEYAKHGLGVNKHAQ